MTLPRQKKIVNSKNKYFFESVKMTNSTENTNICRLCLETEKQGGFLVEIFSSLVNETGGKPLNSKIYHLFSISVCSRIN